MGQKKQTDYEIFFPKVAKGYLSSVFNLSNKYQSQIDSTEKIGFTAFGCQTEKDILIPNPQSICFDLLNDKKGFNEPVKQIF